MSIRDVRDACVNAKRHTKRPEGYGDFMEWAEKKAKTHAQTRCPDCRLWVIWKPKKQAAATPSGDDPGRTPKAGERA